MQDQDFHLKKTTRFAWCTCTSLLLLHGRPVAQPNGKIRHFHISHNAPYPPPAPQKNFCINFCFSENHAYANFEGANEVHYGTCGSVKSEKTLGTRLAYVLVLRRKKEKGRMDHKE